MVLVASRLAAAHTFFLLVFPRFSKTIQFKHPRFKTTAYAAAAIPNSVVFTHPHTSLSSLDHETPVPLDKLFMPPDYEISPDGTSRMKILNGSNIVLSGEPENLKISSAEYVRSSVRTDDCPSDGLPEIALVGRSNVGKSSLLNLLVNRKKLALTSKTPGKTQCINHFLINTSWYFVDLPGYGYARAPRDLRIKWDNFIRDYFLKRSTLISVFLLIDASIPVRENDLQYAWWLTQNKVPMTLIFTKCDKRKRRASGGAEDNVNAFLESARRFLVAAPPWIMTSSISKQGRPEILAHIAQLLNYWLSH